MNINEVESLPAEPIRSHVLTQSRLVGEEYIPAHKARVFTLDELARKYGFTDKLTSDLGSEQAMALCQRYLPFQVLVTEAPFSYALQLSRENFVHILSVNGHLPKTYLSGVSANLPFGRFHLQIGGEMFCNDHGKADLIGKLGAAWKLW